MNILQLKPLTEKEYLATDAKVSYAEYCKQFRLAYPVRTSQDARQLINKHLMVEMKDWTVVFVDQRYIPSEERGDELMMFRTESVNGVPVVYIDLRFIANFDKDLRQVTMDYAFTVAGVTLEQIVRGSLVIDGVNLFFDGVLYTVEGIAATTESLIDEYSDNQDALESALMKAQPWKHESDVRALSYVAIVYDSPVPDNIQKDIDAWACGYYKGVAKVLDCDTKLTTEQYGVWDVGTPLDVIKKWAETALHTQVTFDNHNG